MTKNWRRLVRKISIKALKYSILLFVAFASILPFYWTFISSLKTTEEIMDPDIEWIPSNPRWQTFIEAFAFLRPPIITALLNSTIVTVSHTLLLLLGSSLTAYALAKYRFRGDHTIFLWIISTMMIPGFISLIPAYLLMTWLGWVNTYWSLIIPGIFDAWSIFLLRQYIITIPDEALEAARLSGCSEFGIYWRIILPLTKPAIVAIGLISFVWTWNDFLWPMLMITDRKLFTVQLALTEVWRGTANPYLHLGAANIVLATLPLIVLTVITQKYLMMGWTGLTYTKR